MIYVIIIEGNTMTDKMTTIRVDPLTLRWVNAVRWGLQAKFGREFTLNDVIFLCAVLIDYENSTEFNGFQDDTAFVKFMEERGENLVSALDKDEQECMRSLMQEKSAENYVVVTYLKKLIEESKEKK